MKKHALTTRIWHWLNVVSLVVLFMSGLNISNAHPRLYWGDWGFEPSAAWLHVPRFPGWATIPGYYSLATARDWHVIFAWVFAVSLLLFMLVALLNGHFRRDIATRRAEWAPAAIRSDIRAHLKFDFHHGPGKYNFLQKASYGGVIFVLLPLMIFTGMVMSPGMEAALPWLTDIFGGRQSARSIHFICAWLIFAFFVIHILLVLLSGPFGQLRDMITGGRIDEKA
ncbi:Ni/Fe-hydrogenase b-type cytochrome subunit [Altererythrobacter atlanticus]|uniref:Quinone-reactive Ni/Fe-hydrogenase B-type cytochrome subunit n=1 Tax=Croceibacterium atlanticum TaxID=1267766 RepID=A0A0F7KQ03_9SPHN|nr:cytochrome b/b6 domain-containing protein [Croceibacterium atlanticum]AKH41202.1 Quinone-reactive Ni/Fe-hydrogenase B-type cytochrome subunit [Croceibacterium atlanticum]MBB5732720.1 Ni/Fe-hydrogenase b-type cytochrome subunit [Croceibacterium atlanticum]